ncbi:MAG: polysaccharide biosynthesis protein, partial [Burkholderiales bacterium]|nr:polysaccharide biosynthesis protein [Burkholderiales bacterium]
VLLVTGGTGSFGNSIVEHFLDSEIAEVRVFSRDEKKQDDMRTKYNSSKLKFYLGDVRDAQSLNYAIKDVDYLFHAAALKQVPSCEFNPLEAVKTNVLGTENVLEAAIQSGVERVVVLSTDKAVYPINAMGMSKAIMEKVAVAKSRITARTVINITRYGNVMASRGSVIPPFVKQLRERRAITITDSNMTRFMMSLGDAVNLVLCAFEHGYPGETFVQKAPAATVEVLVKALLSLLGAPDHEVQVIGTRHGEKLYEVLLSREEMAAVVDFGNYYRVQADMRDLNYGKYVDQGNIVISNASEYNSENTVRLDIEGMKALLRRLPLIQAYLRGEYIAPEY